MEVRALRDWNLRGSFTRKIRMDIIATDRRADHPKVETKPCVSAIQPPMRGAMIVAGAVRVWARPM
jgi:hypothetical protein